MLEGDSYDLAHPYPAFCSGDAAEAYRLLDGLPFGLTPHELLEMLGPEESILSNDILLWWQAARMFSPHLLEGREPHRLLYTQVDLSRSYSDRRPLERVTQRTADTILVSSMRRDGSHQPALDLDYPARLGEAQGATHLWLDPTSPAIEYHGPDAIDWADRAMAAFGLERCDRPAGDTWNERTHMGHSIASLAAGWLQPIETLLCSAASLDEPRQAALPEGGVFYRVHGSAWLVPSTSWWHLYTDTTLDAATYLAAVDAAAAGGLLNPGFANAARDRGFTSLRRPGLNKPPAAVRTDDDIPF